jgi:hypothetical protein
MPIQTAIDSISNSQGSPFGFKNRIINGAMVIDQRARTLTFDTAANYIVDRWCQNNGGSAVLTGVQSAVVPSNFTNSLLVTTTSGSSPSAGNLVNIFQPIEGYNVVDLGYGTSTAKTTTVSFWVRSSLTGTFCVAYGNAAFNRSYVTTYTINAANTWEYKTVTIPGDTSGTWLKTNGQGLNLYFDMGSGSNYNTTANAWATGFFTRVSGATSLSATTGATFYITGVQLEKGAQATEFDWKPYSTELSLCHRYFQYYTYTSSSIILVGTTFGTATGTFVFPFYMPMRTAPSTITIPTLGNGSGQWAVLNAAGGYPSTFGTMAASDANPHQMRLNFTGMTSVFAGSGVAVSLYASSSPVVTISAEL